MADQIQMKVWVNGGTVSYDGVDLVFPKDVGVSYSSLIFWKGGNGYEPSTWKVLRPLILLSKHFIDVGSNIGLYSVLAKKINPQIVVDSFEPIPSIYKKNVKFHEANNTDASHLYQKALGNTDGYTSIYLPSSDTEIEEASAATLRVNSWQFQSPNRIEMKVETETLDFFTKTIQIEPPLLLKIDVEDYDAHVLAGALNSLTSYKPFIVCELLPRKHGNQESFNILSSCGYSIFAISHDGLFRIGGDDLFQPRGFTNFLCVHESIVPQNVNYIPFEGIHLLASQREP
jgi:FkbM family methyltransferase